MKTTAEIFARIEEIKEADFFGFQRGDLISFLPFDAARLFLNEGVTARNWKTQEPTKEAVLAEMLDYMTFAWEKANDCRGLSASRSIEHMKAWLWLLGDDLGEKLENMYEYYGKPCLAAICEKYGWDWRSLDDGRWRNSEDDPGIPAPVAIEVTKETP